RVAGAAAVDDEVARLHRDLGAVQPLAAEADRIDEALGEGALRMLPDVAGRGERERLGGAALLEPLLDVLLDLLHRPADERERAAEDDRAARRRERLARRVARGAELADLAVRLQEVDGGAEVDERALARARVGHERSADGTGNAGQAL